ncbi:hypothetical protein F8388_020185 [Cannabis sativa]|uniref:Uncharacterized protein n=1 Tax=Cannabis sativa TaxID=3483 RepID=A0A7J6FL45_CANSA|nr:hypothetical protein F8388_020185 [Cannabis sativa]KAF4400456.1 hypothetical protein G4B88_023249 [Cannabis sativa]
MAAKPSEEVPTLCSVLLAHFSSQLSYFLQANPLVEGTVDGSCDLPVSYSGFQMLKSGFDSGIFPLLVEEASCAGSLKLPSDGSHVQDLFSISVSPQESNDLHCSSHLAFLRFLEVTNPKNDQVYMEAKLNSQNSTDLKMNSTQTFSSCVVDIDVEKMSLKVPESNEKAVESLKSESVLLRVLWRQASVTVGAKLIQLLMNYGTSRDKTGVERVHETPNNQWRRYKRAASFDSRKVVLLFSILSILGTLILIFLTLKVRQSADSIVHV